MVKTNKKKEKVKSSPGAGMAVETVSSEEEQEISNTEFKYDLESNWSLIFTDDNTTDYDVRSNSSGDNNVVISESESEKNLKSFPRRRRKSNSVSDSISTIKVKSNENSIINFPDPIPAAKKEYSFYDNIKFGFNSIKKYIPYIFLSFLIIDKSIELFKTDQIEILPMIEETPSFKTVTKYSTSTLTLFLPGTTELVETTQSTILYNGEQINYESWFLVQQLFYNFVDYSSELSEEAVAGTNKVISEINKESVKSYNKLMKSFEFYLKEMNELKQTIGPKLKDLNENFNKNLKTASKASSNYYDDFLNSKIYQRFILNSKNLLRLTQLKINIGYNNFLNNLNNFKNSKNWEKSLNLIKDRYKFLLNYNYSNDYKKFSLELNKKFNIFVKNSSNFIKSIENSNEFRKLNKSLKDLQKSFNKPGKSPSWFEKKPKKEKKFWEGWF